MNITTDRPTRIIELNGIARLYTETQPGTFHSAESPALEAALALPYGKDPNEGFFTQLDAERVCP